jgi:hypothetical protein
MASQTRRAARRVRGGTPCARAARARVAAAGNALLACAAMLDSRTRRSLLTLAAAAALAGAPPPAARAAADQYLPIGDPLYDELRVLDLFADRAPRVAYPHPGIRPLRARELMGGGAADSGLAGAVLVSRARLERALGRDAAEGWTPDAAHRATPRLYRSAPSGELEVSAALEGTLDADRDTVLAASGSGAHARVGATLGAWFAFSDLVVGRFDGARAFADPIVANTDVTALTEDSYLGYASPAGTWSARLGRSRWQWGPGREGTLVLSGSSAPLTGFEMRAHLASVHADLIALNATLDAAAGEQLAAHRIEWSGDGTLRLGVTEAARYHASGWSPLYAVGLIPYVLVQRLEVEDAPDSTGALRNNVLVSGDVSWRPAEGTRLYGELAVDDLHAKTSANPDKLAWQVGWDGAGMIGAQRLTWNGELTRVWRYVYTSFFGRAYEADGRPIGFPTGPDSRRVSVRVAWDPSVDWQVIARAAETDRGEGSLEAPFVPGSPKVSTSTFQGVVEHARAADLGLRFWPAGGVDATLRGGFERIENLGRVAGVTHSTPRASLEVRLVR